MPRKILVVDDDLETLKLIGLMLERRGYGIAAAHSGTHALSKVQEERPDLIILDVMMPDMDGYEVCRRLRANPATAQIPVIMFTAKTQVDDKVAGFQAGADDYLTKPIHPEELASRVEAVLLRASQRQPAEPDLTQSKVIGFLASKGGVGNTTLAVNVAVALIQGPAKGKRVVLADMLPGMAASIFQLGLPRYGTIVRLLEQPAEELTTQVIEAQLDEHSTGVLLLSGQVEPLGVAASISPAHAEAIIRHLGNLANYVLLDLGVGLGEINRAVLKHCHHVVVTVEPHRAALTLAQALLAEMTGSLNVARHRISTVLVNKTPSAASYTKETIEGILQHNLAAVITPAPEVAFQSAERGIPMLMIQPTSLVSQQIRLLAEHLIGA